MAAPLPVWAIALIAVCGYCVLCWCVIACYCYRRLGMHTIVKRKFGESTDAGDDDRGDGGVGGGGGGWRRRRRRRLRRRVGTVVVARRVRGVALR